MAVSDDDVRTLFDSLSSGAKKFIGIPEVRVILNLAVPVRQLIRTYLLRWKAGLVSEKDNLVTRVARGDVVANKIAEQRRLLERALEPIEALMQRIPWEKIAADSPGVAKLLNQMIDAVPAAIPETGLTEDMKEFFEGIQSYGDLKNKIRELSYDAQRVLAISTHVNRLNKKVDNNLDRIAAYLELLGAAI